MALRIANIDDLDIVLDLSYKFADSSEYATLVDKTKVKGIVENILRSNSTEEIILLYDNIGLLAGKKLPFTFGIMNMATEVAWFVEPEYRNKGVGKELIEAFQFWAKKTGCFGVILACLDDEVGSFYEKLGYKLYERAYFKRI